MTITDWDTTGDVFFDWERGEATDIQAARALMSDLREIESELKPLEDQKARIREQLSHIVARAGAIELDGLGRASITAPTITKSYDTKQLNDLVQRLVQDGYADIAQAILKCQKTTDRAGSLRIEAPKQKPPR